MSGYTFVLACLGAVTATNWLFRLVDWIERK